MKESRTDPASIRLEPVDIALKTLVLSEQRHTSIRNAFQEVITGHVTHYRNKDIQAAYHYSQEVIRRRSRLEQYLEFIISRLENQEHVSSLLRDSLVRHLVLLVIFLYTEEQYHGQPPSYRKMKKIARVVLASNGKRLTTTQKILLDAIFKQARDLRPNEVETSLHDESITKRLSYQYNYPRWLIEKLLEQHGTELLMNLLKSENHPPTRYFRIRLSHVDQLEDILSALSSFPLTVKTIRWPPDHDATSRKEQLIIIELAQYDHRINAALRTFVPTVGVIQDKASALIPSLLFPMNDEVVLDLTAGPGQKFTELIEYARDSHVIGCEYHEKRLHTIQRWLESIKPWAISRGTSCHSILTDSTDLPLPNNTADKVLLDAPCSSTGILAKYPDHRWHPIKLEFITALQQKLLAKAISVLKPGGIGVYSVCSLLKEEGEWLISKFLDRIELLPFDQTNTWTVPSEIGKRTFRHLHGTDNFFVAMFRKK